MSTDGPLPRKVLHVMNSASGGAALSTLDLARALREVGVESCAVCHDAGRSADCDALQEGMRGEVEFHTLYWWNRQIRTAWWKRPLFEAWQSLRTGKAHWSARAVAAAALRFGAELIHTNTLTTPEGGLAARRLGLPHAWHIRELVGPGRPFRFPVEGPALARLLRRRASVVIANSNASAEHLRALLSGDFLRVVPNGIDVEEFARCEPPADRDHVVVAMVGNLTTKVKKHALFIDAAALVAPATSVEFRIYGDDPSRGGTRDGGPYVNSLVHQIGARGLAGRLRLMGFESDRAAMMSAIDVLVHPQEAESFGRIAVEAMAAGRPVVGARGGGIAEIVVDGESGLLAEPDDAAGLARCIEKLAADAGLRRRMGEAGRGRARERYSLQACRDGVLRAYRVAMGSPLGNARTMRMVA